MKKSFLILLFIGLLYPCLSQETGTFIDNRDGKSYKLVKIGAQTWMAENLAATKYNDGSAISNVTDNTVWKQLTTGAYCWYNHDAAAYKDTYGALYNWYAVNTGKLCPIGWHVPAKEDWEKLITYLGGESLAGGKLKEAGTMHWDSPNKGASNSSGFNALPGGSCSFFDGVFFGLGTIAYWWGCRPYDEINAYDLSLMCGYAEAYPYTATKQGGLSVRCVKD